MEYVYTFFLLPMLVIFFFSAIVGAVMFCIDIFKWSKRPEKFEDIKKDLTSTRAEDNSTYSSIKVDTPKNSTDDDIDDIF